MKFKKLNEDYIDTYIEKEDKVTKNKFLKEFKNYPIGTYIRLCVKGNINDISQYTYGKLKTADNEWSTYSSFYGTQDTTSTDQDIINLVDRKDIKNIGVKFPASINESLNEDSEYGYRNGNRYYGGLPAEPNAKEYGKSITKANNHYQQMINDMGISTRKGYINEKGYGRTYATEYSGTIDSINFILVLVDPHRNASYRFHKLVLDGKEVDPYKSYCGNKEVSKFNSLYDVKDLLSGDYETDIVYENNVPYTIDESLKEDKEILYIIKDGHGHQLSRPNQDDNELWDRVDSMDPYGKKGYRVVVYTGESLNEDIDEDIKYLEDHISKEEDRLTKYFKQFQYRKTPSYDWEYKQNQKAFKQLQKDKLKLAALKSNKEVVKKSKLTNDIKKITGWETIKTMTSSIRGYRPITGGQFEVDVETQDWFRIIIHGSKNREKRDFIEAELNKLGYETSNAGGDILVRSLKNKLDLDEDTVKQNGKWVNKGKNEHKGMKFKTINENIGADKIKTLKDGDKFFQGTIVEVKSINKRKRSDGNIYVKYRVYSTDYRGRSITRDYDAIEYGMFLDQLNELGYAPIKKDEI